MEWNPLAVYHFASDLLTYVRFFLDRTDAGIPDGMRVGVVPGQVAVEAGICSLLAVTIGNTYPSSNFPTPNLVAPVGGCASSPIGVDLAVQIHRCAPGPTGMDNLAPSVDALDQAARVWAADARAIWAGASCYADALRTADLDAMVKIQRPIGPTGGMVGSETVLAIGFNDGCKCDEVLL